MFTMFYEIVKERNGLMVLNYFYIFLFFFFKPSLRKNIFLWQEVIGIVMIIY